MDCNCGICYGDMKASDCTAGLDNLKIEKCKLLNILITQGNGLTARESEKIESSLLLKIQRKQKCNQMAESGNGPRLRRLVNI